MSSASYMSMGRAHEQGFWLLQQQPHTWAVSSRLACITVPRPAMHDVSQKQKGLAPQESSCQTRALAMPAASAETAAFSRIW